MELGIGGQLGGRLEHLGLPAVCRDGAYRRVLALSHQPAVTDDNRLQDRSELTFSRLWHALPGLAGRTLRTIAWGPEARLEWPHRREVRSGARSGARPSCSRTLERAKLEAWIQNDWAQATDKRAARAQLAGSQHVACSYPAASGVQTGQKYL